MKIETILKRNPKPKKNADKAFIKSLSTELKSLEKVMKDTPRNIITSSLLDKTESRIKEIKELIDG